ncbi:hypothetical protein EDB89DRAFT_1171512 [Lactarius sanguifluus]|nr:hypothetical protein EDB89DRAFT_1171512 [Lactarius sanguifluus]
MSSDLMRLIPTHCFDVHVLRTLKQSFAAMLLRLEGQHGPCRATESIQEVVRALNLTMRDVEEAWSVWRHECVRVTLRSGISPSLPSSYDDVAELAVRLCVHPSAHWFRSLATPSRSPPGCLRRISVTVPPLSLRGQPLPVTNPGGGRRRQYRLLKWTWYPHTIKPMGISGNTITLLKRATFNTPSSLTPRPTLSPSSTLHRHKVLLLAPHGITPHPLIPLLPAINRSSSSRHLVSMSVRHRSHQLL